jgi:quinoprotein glucose dehydrogenase
MRQTFTEADINPLLPDSSYQEVKKRFRVIVMAICLRYFLRKEQLYFPDLMVGGEWGGPSFDPETGILYVNANQMAWVIQAVDLRNKTRYIGDLFTAGQRLFQANCMSCHGQDRKGSGNFPSLIGRRKKIYSSYF